MEERAQEEAAKIKRHLLETEATNEYLREPGSAFLRRFGLDPDLTRGDAEQERTDLDTVAGIRDTFRKNGLRFRSDPAKSLSSFFERGSPLDEAVISLDQYEVPWPELDGSGAISATYVLQFSGETDPGDSADPAVRASPTVTFISPGWLRQASSDQESLDTRQKDLLRWIQNVGPGSASREAELILTSAEGSTKATRRVSRHRGLSDGAATTVSFWIHGKDEEPRGGLSEARLSTLVTASRDFPWVIVSPILQDDRDYPSADFWAKSSDEMMQEMRAVWGHSRELDSGIPIVSAIIDGAVQSGTIRIRELSRELQEIESNDSLTQTLRRRRRLDDTSARLRDVAQGVDELEQAIRDIVQEERAANEKEGDHFDCGATELHEEWELLEARYRRLDNQFRNQAQQESRRFSEFMGAIVAFVSAFVIGPSLVFAALAIPGAAETDGSNVDYSHIVNNALVGVGLGLGLIVIAVLASLVVRRVRRWKALP